MALLSKQFREKVGKMKDVRIKQEGGYDIAYPTGFDTIDFRNGSAYQGIKNGEPFTNYLLGFKDGSMNMIVGRSGCGKTTLAIQIAGNIARMFPEAVIYHDDIENGSTFSRRKQLVGMSDEEMDEKYIYRNSGITIENIYQRIKMIYETKMENYDDLCYNTGFYDANGDEIIKLVPTVYIIDSVASMTLEKYADVDEMMGQMSGPATARANKQLANMLLQILKPANIIVIFINHINDNVSLDIVPPKSALTFLSNKETLPGGKGIVYLQDSLIYLYDNKKFNVDKDSKYNIDGTVVMANFLKSRNNKAGKAVPLIFDQEKGYDNELSILQYLNDSKLINGAGRGMYLGDDKENKDAKFSNKTFKEKLHENEEFANLVMNTAVTSLSEMISYSDTGEEEKEKQQKFSAGLRSRLK